MNLLQSDRPIVLLTRHFFVRLFDFELVADAGSGSLARTVIGIASVFAAIGALLPRIIMYRYRELRALGDAEQFQAAVLSDHTFMLAAPMWIIAVVAVLSGPSLFPDETDFRVLGPLPVHRRLVFGAKLIALALFASIFMVSALLSLMPLFFLTALGTLADTSWYLLLPAFFTAGVVGSVFAALTIAAVHAVLLLFVPRERLLTVSAAVGSLMLFVLVMALPFVGFVPAIQAAFDRGDVWLHYFPPAWMLGVERLLVGDTRFVQLAGLGVLGILVAGSIAAAAYIALYRDFSRVMTRPAADQGERLRLDAPATGVRAAARPARAAIASFSGATLRRSVLHQGVFVAISSVGAALVTLGLLNVDFSPSTVRETWELRDAAIWAPFALSFIAIMAVRAAFLPPIELRANWVFRLMERPQDRGDQLDAVVSTVVQLGVLAPVVLLFPLQWHALGWRALVTAAITALWGWLFAEALLVEKRRIPFTCSYIVGKGFVPQLLLLGFLTFVGHTAVGRLLASLGSQRPLAFALAVCAVLIAAALGLRRHRRRATEIEPLEFTDALPTEPNPLRLWGD